MHSKRYYDWLGREPATWRSSALELKRAADAVAIQWAQDLDPTTRANPTAVPPNLGPPYMLLAAFAVENLAKAILIKRDPNLFPLTVPSKGGLKTHNLVDLVDRVGGTWTGADLTLVRRLAQFAEWSGRYPTPTAPGELAAWQGHDDVVLGPEGTSEVIEGGTELPGVAYARDPAEVDRLFARLFELLDAQPQ
jgi:hypothetical protein